MSIPLRVGIVGANAEGQGSRPRSRDGVRYVRPAKSTERMQPESFRAM